MTKYLGRGSSVGIIRMWDAGASVTRDGFLCSCEFVVTRAGGGVGAGDQTVADDLASPPGQEPPAS